MSSTVHLTGGVFDLPAREVDTLNASAWELRFSDPRRGALLAGQAIVAARAALDVRGEAVALRNAGACRCRLTEYDAALTDLAAAVRLFDVLGDRAGKASALQWTGSVHWRRSDGPSALRALLDSLELARAAGDRDSEGDALNTLGTIAHGTGELDRALEYFSAALTAKEQTGDTVGILSALTNIGIVHGELGDPAKALEHHTRVLPLARESGNVELEAILRVNLGSSAERLGEYGRALDAYGEGLRLARGGGLRRVEAHALHMLGEAHRQMGDAERALGFYREAIGVSDAEDARFIGSATRADMARALLSLGRTAEAEETAREALSRAVQLDAKMVMYDAHEVLALAREAAGDAAEALHHHREFHRVREEVFSARTERRIRAAMVEAEVVHSRREAALLRQRNEALAEANEEKARLVDALRTQAEELERLTRQDALTGVHNRRHVDAALALEWERARRFGRALTVAMIDVDHFKEVNDRHSHAAGDAVLRELGRLLREGTRAVDVVGRYGGEEFILLLVETPPGSAAVLCEKLRATVERHDWGRLVPGLAVTVSIGVAGDAAAGSPAALLAAADARLYRAKGSGRNRVVS